MSVRFGLAYDFRNPARWERPWAEHFGALLDQIVFAEELGFDSVWITEHHFVDDGYCPSPITVLAAIAARTKRIQLSTDILLMPLYNAVRLAEDAATVDILSNGRLMLGLGMGYRDVEFEAFGTSRKERARRTEEGIDVLRGAWGDEPFTYEGRFYQLRDLNVTPKPVQKPHPPLWLAATSEPAARRAARYDMNLLPQHDRRLAYEPWLDELNRLGKNPADYRIGLIKPWFVADGREDAVWQEAREGERYRAAVYQPWIREGGFPTLPGDAVPIDQSYLVGSPSEITDRLHAQREVLPITDFISWGTPVGMDPADPGVRRSLERFATEVIPQFR
jgi:probable F420-dependent oxidoreductase